MFVDKAEVELIAGSGGKGSVHFRREKFVPNGGPDGGDGGRGGHIIIQVDSNLHTLQDIRYRKRYVAQNGGIGRGSRKTGKNGKNIIIRVPLGTIIKWKDKNDVIADLVENDQSITICRGGKGGKGNIRFKSSTNRTPMKAQTGLPGETGTFSIELKVLADVGLVGLPNVGKSTLLSSLSSARPKIADYPFTTLQPKLGIVKFSEYDSFVMADIPGLIEGANLGKGLGHQFLKHIERNKVLLFMIDSLDNTPYKTFKLLRNELLKFNSDMVIKPFLVCRTKSDLDIKLSEQWNQFPDDITSISSITGEGLRGLVRKLVQFF